MCGRFSQYRTPWEYLKPIGFNVPLVGGTDPEPVGRFNVAPRSRVRILHLEPDGLRWNFVPWGWAPFWAKGTRPPAINARSETAATGKFFKQIWETGRCVIPADGWYEWVKNPDDPKQKQPYYIHRKDGEPMYFAGIGQFRRDGSGPKEGDGFVIITTDSDQGVVDIHDRRPVVFTPETAANWLNLDLAKDEAALMARQRESVEAFEWYPVGREVGNVRNDGESLQKPKVR